jgi:hypothetical protein
MARKPLGFSGCRLGNSCAADSYDDCGVDSGRIHVNSYIARELLYLRLFQTGEHDLTDSWRPMNRGVRPRLDRGPAIIARLL